MAYTPINWQMGDTITAEKLNKMDNGWGVGEAELINEMITTMDSTGDIYRTSLNYGQLITSPTITIIFDDTEYVCSNNSSNSNIGEYGAPYNEETGGFDFSIYPFNLYSGEGPSGVGQSELLTSTDAPHRIVVYGIGVVASDDFSAAVNACVIPSEVDTSTMPMRCISGMTYRTEIEDAIAAGKLVYFWTSNHGCFFITKAGRPFTIFPESSEVTATHDSTGLLSIKESRP